MRDITTKFGATAGKIWNALNDKGCLNKDKIIETTKIDEKDLHSAIGWLARENKISVQEEDYYKLEETNLDYKIGTHAGRIWKILDIWGDADFFTLMKLSDLSENEVYTALGWLARENKILIDEKNRYYLK